MIVTLSREKHTVTNARRPVRQERSDRYRQPMPVVAVTGAASGIGPALTARLAASRHVRKVIAIDGQRGDIAGVTWRVADVRDPALAGRLAGVDVVVHADFDLTPDSDPGSAGPTTSGARRPCSPPPPRARSGACCW